MPGRTRWLGVVAAAVAMALSIAAVSAEEAPPGDSSMDASGPNIVRAADLARTEPGTPAHRVLSWFQAIQLHDDAAVLEALTRMELAARGGSIRAAAETVGSVLGKPSVVSTRVDGARATVRILVLHYAGNESRPSGAAPLTIRLRRQAGVWQIADASYVLEVARAIRGTQ